MRSKAGGAYGLESAPRAMDAVIMVQAETDRDRLHPPFEIPAAGGDLRRTVLKSPRHAGAPWVGFEAWSSPLPGADLSVCATSVEVDEMSWTGDRRRDLTRDERVLAHSVFGSTLPPWDRIFITDGVQLDGSSYWTQYVPPNPREPTRQHPTWLLHLRPNGFASTSHIKGIFIHELVHVWQSHHSFSPGSYMRKALQEHIKGHITRTDPYLFAAGGAWDEYGIEQQAQLVEEWFNHGASHNDPLYPYIEHHILAGRNQRSPHLMIPEPIHADRPLQASAKEPPKRIVLDGVLFDINSTRLKPEAQIRLSEAIVLLGLRKTPRVVIAGHTDSTGPAAHNKRLSAQRAKAVKDWFVQRGVQGAESFEVVGYGQDRPVASNTTADGRRTNRRVEIFYA